MARGNYGISTILQKMAGQKYLWMTLFVAGIILVTGVRLYDFYVGILLFASGMVWAIFALWQAKRITVSQAVGLP